MPALNRGDFFDGSQSKTAATGKYAGQTSEQIVLEKIKDKRYFTIAKGDKKIYGASLDTSVWPYQLSYVTNISNLQKHSGITNIGKKDRSEIALNAPGNITSTSTQEPVRGVPGQTSVGSVLPITTLLKDADICGGAGSGGVA